MHKSRLYVLHFDQAAFLFGDAQLDLALPRGLEAAFGLHLGSAPFLVLQEADIALHRRVQRIARLRRLRNVAHPGKLPEPLK